MKIDRSKVFNKEFYSVWYKHHHSRKYIISRRNAYIFYVSYPFSGEKYYTKSSFGREDVIRI
jgi:hypothetical protein